MVEDELSEELLAEDSSPVTDLVDVGENKLTFQAKYCDKGRGRVITDETCPLIGGQSP